MGPVSRIYPVQQLDSDQSLRVRDVGGITPDIKVAAVQLLGSAKVPDECVLLGQSTCGPLGEVRGLAAESAKEKDPKHLRLRWRRPSRTSTPNLHTGHSGGRHVGQTPDHPMPHSSCCLAAASKRRFCKPTRSPTSTARNVQQLPSKQSVVGSEFLARHHCRTAHELCPSPGPGPTGR